MEVNESAQPPAATPIQQDLLQQTFALPPQRSKLPLVLLIIISFLSVSGLIYFYLQTKSLQSKMAKKTTQSQTPTTNKDSLLDEESHTLNYFNNELFNQYKNVIQIPIGHQVRHVTSVESDNAWIVETSGSKLEPQIRSIVEERDFFLFNPSQNTFTKLNSEPMLCFVEEAKKISKAENRLLISGPCNIGYFTNLYSYNKNQINIIPLSDPNKLLATNTAQGTAGLIINSNKSSAGKLARAINTEEETIFVVDLVNHDGSNPPIGIDTLNPSQGLAIFSYSTGALKDLIIYGEY